VCAVDLVVVSILGTLCVYGGKTGEGCGWTWDRQTLRKAAFTSGWVISWCRQRFSTRSLLVAPELRQAMLMLSLRLRRCEEDEAEILGRMLRWLMATGFKSEWFVMRLNDRDSGRLVRIHEAGSLLVASVAVFNPSRSYERRK
jgi:hypothetical protein